MTFQQIILALQRFWSKQGCVLGEPYDVEKGAGTMNPATFLRTIGPEPWNVAYVEPSRRPDDGRYGDNPNRLYQHHQFQVIMKPSPNNIQETYLESLKELGIDPTEEQLETMAKNARIAAGGPKGSAKKLEAEDMLKIYQMAAGK